MPLTETKFFLWVFLPLLIFLARTADVSIGTIRTIQIYRGRKGVAFLLGFVEIMIWIGALTFVLKHLSNFLNIVAYAAGFGMGNFVGIYLEERWVAGKLLIRIFAVAETTALTEHIKTMGYGVTHIDAKGQAGGPIHILYVIINRKDYRALAETMQRLHPKAFYTVEDIKEARAGVFPPSRSPWSGFFPFWKVTRNRK